MGGIRSQGQRLGRVAAAVSLIVALCLLTPALAKVRCALTCRIHHPQPPARLCGADLSRSSRQNYHASGTRHLSLLNGGI
jgi:hypothetical protein